MKSIITVMLLLVWLSATAYSQEQAPQLLLHAAQCLQAKKFLPRVEGSKLTFGYALDAKSYPGDRIIYIVNYLSAARPGGLVFEIFLTEHDGRQVFNIQNNASFIISKDEPTGILFIDPPLGGTWTQEHLASAIRDIGKQPRFTIPVKDLSVLESSVTCESYTDPQPKSPVK